MTRARMRNCFRIQNWGVTAPDDKLGMGQQWKTSAFCAELGSSAGTESPDDEGESTESLANSDGKLLYALCCGEVVDPPY